MIDRHDDGFNFYDQPKYPIDPEPVFTVHVGPCVCLHCQSVIERRRCKCWWRGLPFGLERIAIALFVKPIDLKAWESAQKDNRRAFAAGRRAIDREKK